MDQHTRWRPASRKRMARIAPIRGERTAALFLAGKRQEANGRRSHRRIAAIGEEVVEKLQREDLKIIWDSVAVEKASAVARSHPDKRACLSLIFSSITSPQGERIGVRGWP